MEILSVLKEIGLEDKEASVYLSLLKLNEATATKIAKESKIERTLVYKILDKLKDRGLISYNIKNKKQYFYPSDPKKMLEELKEKEQRFREILPYLSSFQKIPEKEKIKIEIVEGVDGFKNLIRGVLILKQDYIGIGGGFNFQNMLGYFGKYWMKYLEKHKIHERLILPEGLKITLRSKYSEFRYLPKGYPSIGGFIVMKNKVGFIIRSKPIIIIVIENEKFSNAFRSYFELLWKVTKK